jgi:hypothetical protein
VPAAKFEPVINLKIVKAPGLEISAAVKTRLCNFDHVTKSGLTRVRGRSPFGAAKGPRIHPFRKNLSKRMDCRADNRRT